MTLPINFLYLGGDKCGSTWVHHVLSKHPDVTLARAKELFYFDRFYDKGPKWYVRQFPSVRASTRVGEICHDYLYSEPALIRIARDMPQDSRFLITVRAPIERTLSHYKYLRKIGRTSLGVDQALASQPQIVEHSMFGKHVARAQRILGADRVHVLPFELLKRDPAAFGQSLCMALNIDFLDTLPYSDRVLEAQSARNPALVRTLRAVGWGLRACGAPQIVSQVKSHPSVQRTLYKNTPPDTSARLSAEALAALRHHFAEDQTLLRQCVPNLDVVTA